MDRYEITPGRWQCVTVLHGMAHRGGHPHPRFGPPMVPVSSYCGCEYEEGSMGVTPMCSTPQCGRYSVGMCIDCNMPVCGRCSPGGGGLLCRADQTRRHNEAEAKTRSIQEAAERSAKAREAEVAAARAKDHARKVETIQSQFGDDRDRRAEVKALNAKLGKPPRRSMNLGCWMSIILAFPAYVIGGLLGGGLALAFGAEGDDANGYAAFGAVALVVVVFVVPRLGIREAVWEHRRRTRDRLVTKIGCGEPSCTDCRVSG